MLRFVVYLRRDGTLDLYQLSFSFPFLSGLVEVSYLLISQFSLLCFIFNVNGDFIKAIWASSIKPAFTFVIPGMTAMLTFQRATFSHLK